ncbi:tRNA synthetases class II core domain (F)-domain-containing protein [Thamnocephalis sphaerospora]|uniref:phenylalanine--tRNA ligase n=1 Tax=Thamnocephalis sphaerospora TaxID=78915 RepID=A0A4P9XRB4_9FUNG|nr:tRNA synthetases class II core domain (F)-domain-containing protein [Thamnocephalis sphaerospora]|eukprot:RKP08616.1 tRNA synthetases class II core domain (F)-domain-containing protein [Thamnocephalis sphaerospora]
MTKDEIQQLVLTTLDRDGQIADSKSLGVPDQLELLGVLNSLLSMEVIEYKPIDRDLWVLTDEGSEIAEHGSHEVKVFNAVPTGDVGIPVAELQKQLGAVAKIGQGQAFKNKWIGKKGANVVRLVDSVEDATQADLRIIRETANHPDAALPPLLRRRKLCDKQKITTYAVTKGSKFTLNVAKQASELTMEMLQSGAWKTLSFKKFNFDAEGVPPTGGHLHPLMKVREEFRQIFFEMGFTEMPANHFVESSFWNFDALYQPQQHPARDAHDTFFLKDPAATSDFPAEYMDKVRTVHSKGGFGSTGYGYDWKVEEAEKLLLRTHTTAVSANMLYRLAQQPEFKPAKYFSIDRVFRNETVDATHLAEFHQVEGVIADRNLTLGNLIGFMDQFFRKMGIENIVFKPTYNPYTEPSMEIFSWHEGLGKWVEVGNSGMFRPEMLLPMGLDPDVRVIAWGLSLERPTMIKYGIDNIRDLIGHKIDLDLIRNNPVCR